MSDDALEATPYPKRRDRTLVLVLVLVAASVGLHLMAFQGLSAWARIRAADSPLNRPLELVMVEVEPPKPPPEAPKPEPAKPPPNEPPPETPPKPVPVVVGLSLSSTTTAGGFAAPVGNTAYGKIADKAEDPSQVQAYRGPKYVPVYQVDREPETLAEVQIPYPPEARRAGIEGKVIMSIRIDAHGQVTSVKVLSSPGYGLDEAAATAMKRVRFRPAIKASEPVETEIKYTYVFVLD